MDFSKNAAAPKSRNELSTIPKSKISAALKLGVANPLELDSDVIKVDRKLLAQLVHIKSRYIKTNFAQMFFEDVMKATETYILWPHHIKLKARSIKDPSVLIVGQPAAIPHAKAMILAKLEPKVTRVMLKMDVAYTEHSSIIGNSGNNIKYILENTKTFIHFPDSNCSNVKPKSNRVALNGPVESIDRARSLVRLFAPLCFSFEIPMAAELAKANYYTPYVNEVEMKYDVEVIFTKHHLSAMVVVKGIEEAADQLKAATELLIRLISNDVRSVCQILEVHMSLVITPEVHKSVKGLNDLNLLSIMTNTGTTIVFPDNADTRVMTFENSSVTITGTIDGVYRARQQLIGYLPIALVFDIPDKRFGDAYKSKILSLSTKYDIKITMSNKKQQGNIPVITINGIEKYVDKIFTAVNEILLLWKSFARPNITEVIRAPEASSSLTWSNQPALCSSVASSSADNLGIVKPTTSNSPYYSADMCYTGEAAPSYGNNLGTFKPTIGDGGWNSTHYSADAAYSSEAAPSYADNFGILKSTTSDGGWNSTDYSADTAYVSETAPSYADNLGILKPTTGDGGWNSIKYSAEATYTSEAAPIYPQNLGIFEPTTSDGGWNSKHYSADAYSAEAAPSYVDNLGIQKPITSDGSWNSTHYSADATYTSEAAARYSENLGILKPTTSDGGWNSTHYSEDVVYTPEPAPIYPDNLGILKPSTSDGSWNSTHYSADAEYTYETASIYPDNLGILKLTTSDGGWNSTHYAANAAYSSEDAPVPTTSDGRWNSKHYSVDAAYDAEAAPSYVDNLGIQKPTTSDGSWNSTHYSADAAYTFEAAARYSDNLAILIPTTSDGGWNSTHYSEDVLYTPEPASIYPDNLGLLIPITSDGGWNSTHYAANASYSSEAAPSYADNLGIQKPSTSDGGWNSTYYSADAAYRSKFESSYPVDGDWNSTHMTSNSTESYRNIGITRPDSSTLLYYGSKIPGAGRSFRKQY